MFEKNLFDVKKELIVVADFFAHQYVGGAELTLNSILNTISSTRSIKLLNSHMFNSYIAEANRDKEFLFGNFSNIPNEDLGKISEVLQNYSVMECDYKFCKYRSIELHKKETGEDCNCHLSTSGKRVFQFLTNAKNIYWMSEKQKDRQVSFYPDLLNANNVVLCSFFDKNTLSYISDLKNTNRDKKSNKYIVLKSQSWIKGYELARDYCIKNNLEYEEVWGVPYEELLVKLSKSKGLVYLPRGGDTCPRLVIEAKMLDCDLVLNDDVQHKDEEWFNDFESIIDKWNWQNKTISDLYN